VTGTKLFVKAAHYFPHKAIGEKTVPHCGVNVG